MPIDPRVPLGALGDGGGNRSSGGPLQTLGALMKIKESQMDFEARRQEAEVRRRALEDDDATRAALQRYERPEEAIAELRRQGRHQAVMSLSRQVYDERKAKLDEDDAMLKNHQTRFENGASLLDTVTDDKTLALIRPQLIKMMEPSLGTGVGDLIPSTYGDGKWKTPLVQAGTSRALKIQQHRDNLQMLGQAHQLGLVKASEFRNAMGLPADTDVAEWSQNALKAQDLYQEALARELKDATNNEQYQTIMAAAVDHGVPEVVRKKFPPTWSEANAARAGRLGMTVHEQEQAAANQIRAEATADREARLGNRPGGLTEVQIHREEDRRDNEDQETDKFVKDEWKKVKPPAGGWPKNERGIGVKPEFSYDLLPQGIKNEYANRKITSHDKYRQRVLGLPPIVEAARAAVARGDTAGYEKLRAEYHEVTSGTDNLARHVPMPDAAAGSTAQARIRAIAAEARSLDQANPAHAKRLSELAAEWQQLTQQLTKGQR